MHPMKKFLTLLTLALTVAIARAALPEPDLLARIHFAGGDAIAAAPNYAAFAKEFSSPEARALRQQVADKLAPWLAKNLNASVANGGAALRPLFDDLQSAEWFLESQAGQGGRADLALAIKLDAARAQVWQSALKSFFPAATFKQNGGWLIFDAGQGMGKLGQVLAQKISTTSTNWLTADINWPRLGETFPKAKELGLPQTAFDIFPDKTDIAVRGLAHLPAALAVDMTAWRFPTNTIHQPLVSFTAVRGLMAWLRTQSWGQAYAVDSLYDQTFIWALAGTPFQTFAASPVANGVASLARLDAQLEPVVAARNMGDGFLMPASLRLSNTLLTLKGFPEIDPSVKALKQPTGDFLFAGIFPNPVRSRPLPPELFQQLATPNLVAYHWEVTSERIKSMGQMSQLLLLLSRHKQLGGTSAAMHWMTNAASVTGTSISEVTQVAPDQLKFTRRSPTGLTAFVFVALANWFDAPDFPGNNLKLPPLSERAKQIRAKRQQQTSPQIISLPAPPAPPK